PEATSPAAGAQRLVAAGGVRLEPVRALPARLLAPGRAQLLEPLVGGRDAERAPGLALVPWVLDVVVGRVDLGRPAERVVAARVMASEAAGVHLPDVEARNALDEPLGDEFRHSARSREAGGAEAGGDPEAAHVRRP